MGSGLGKTDRRKARLRAASLDARQGKRRMDTLDKKPIVDIGKDEQAVGNEDTFEELREAGKKGSLLGKFNSVFQDALQSGRGGDRFRDAVAETAGGSNVTADDLALRRAKNVNMQHVFIPEGVIIYGSIASSTDTEISGRVEGDVNVEGRLYLGTSALVSGNVKATSCKVDGLVEGKMECARDLELGKTGRLNADIVVGKRATVAGQVYGNLATGGKFHLQPAGRLEGDIVAKSICVEEGSTFNGKCTMHQGGEEEKYTE